MKNRLHELLRMQLETPTPSLEDNTASTEGVAGALVGGLAGSAAGLISPIPGGALIGGVAGAVVGHKVEKSIDNKDKKDAKVSKEDNSAAEGTDGAVAPPAGDVPAATPVEATGEQTGEVVAPQAGEKTGTEEPVSLETVDAAPAATPEVPEVPAAPAAEPAAAEPAAAPAAEPAAAEPAPAEPAAAVVTDEDVDAAGNEADKAIAGIDGVEPVTPPAAAAEPAAEPAAAEPAAAEPVAAEPAAVAAEPAPAAVEPAAAEDATGAVDAGDEAPTDTAGSDSVAVDDDSSAAELAESAADLDNHVNSIHDAFAIHASFEKIAVALEQAAADGGLNLQAAEFMRISVEDLRLRAGIESEIVPSLEDFGGSQTTVYQGTKDAASRVGEMAKKVWDAVVRMIKNAWQVIKKFAARLFAAGGRLKVRAQRLQNAVKDVKGSAKVRQIELGSLAAKLAVGTKIGPIAEGNKNLLAVLDQSIRLDEEGKAQITADYNALKAAAKGEVNYTPRELSVPVIFNKRKRRADGGEAIETPVLPGNVTFSINTLSREFLGHDIRVFKFFMDKADVNIPDNLKVAVLSVSEISEIAKSAIEVARLSEKLEGEGKALADISERLTDQILAGSEAQFDDAMKLSASIRAFQMRAASIGVASAKIGGWAISTAGAYLTLAEKSLEQYGVEAAGPKALEAPAA